MLLTNALPNGGNGTLTLQIKTEDIEGNSVTLGTKTITCDNANAVKPFGAIDTPEQGGAASGSNFVNWGWVLTPQPNTIPTDGSTINVWVDGINIGKPTYNNYREDIATLFPGYNNSNGAVGYFYLDTTLYENGVHTIAWSAVDDAGNKDGIGSRYFSIENSHGAWSMGHGANHRGNPAGLPDLSEILIDYYMPIEILKGFKKDVEPGKVYPDEKGISYIKLEELERVVIFLNSTQLITHHSSQNNISGYLLAGEKLKPLPIGSYLDRERGIFYWQPGPGHIGNYYLSFIVRELNGMQKRKDLLLNIIPKFSMKE